MIHVAHTRVASLTLFPAALPPTVSPARRFRNRWQRQISHADSLHLTAGAGGNSTGGNLNNAGNGGAGGRGKNTANGGWLSETDKHAAERLAREIAELQDPERWDGLA